MADQGGLGPEKPEAETPSPDAANDAAKKVKGRGKVSRSEVKAREAAEELARKQAEQQARFLAQLAEMLTGAANGALAGMDGLYAEEIELVNEANPGTVTSFTLNEKEQISVATTVAMGLQQCTPEWLARYGFVAMCAAVVLSIGVPRVTLAIGLNKISKDLRKKRKEQEVPKVPDSLPSDVK